MAKSFDLSSQFYPGGVSPTGHTFGVRFRIEFGELTVFPKGGSSFTANKEQAIELAKAILQELAPHELVPAVGETQRSDASRVKFSVDDIGFVLSEHLKGSFVNITEGAGAPTVAFGDHEQAVAEGERLARKMPGKRVITAKIDTVQKAVVTTTIEKD